MANAVRELDIVTRLKGAEEVKRGLDGENVSVKELQIRIKDLDTRMKELIATHGKYAYETKAGTIIERERKYALEQLLSMEEAHEQAVQRSTRGVGSLSSAMIAATGSVSGLGTGVSVLTNALFSGAGLTAGLAAAVAGFSLLMQFIKGSREEMEKMKSSISGMLEIDGPGGKFKMDPTKLPDAIAKLKKDLDYYFGKTSEGTQRGEFKPAGTQETWKVLLEVLEEANEKYQTQLEYINAMRDAGFLYTEEQDKQVKKQKQFNEALREMLLLIGQSSTKPVKQKSTSNLLGSRMFERKEVKIDDPYGLKDVLKEQEKNFNEFISNTANVFRSEFGGAWQDIFGEANSLFEKLMASWAEMLLMRVGTGILSSLFGGIPIIGDLFGFSRSVTGGGKIAQRYGMGN